MRPRLWYNIFLGLLLGLLAEPAWAGELSPLASVPDWRSLDSFQQTITKDEFVHLIDSLYVPGGFFWPYVELHEEGLTLFSDTAHTQPLWALEFAPAGSAPRPRPAKAKISNPVTDPLTVADHPRPLAGKTVCLDPGHIGGNWAVMEERSFALMNDRPVVEAHLNLLAARAAATLLEKAGAQIVWTKENEEPVTPLRPQDLRMEALRAFFLGGSSSGLPHQSVLIDRRLASRAELLFYRVAEINARAERVNRFQPDLTLCIHFNAAPWSGDGTPEIKKLIPESRLVVFVLGCYGEDELHWDDQKFTLVAKLLEHSQETELLVANSIAQKMADHWKMPPERYDNWKAVHRIGPNPYVFSRNLLANRLYSGPVVFVEGPYMNAKDCYPRLIAGDYEGTQQIPGYESTEPQRSIFKEYGECLAQGVIEALSAQGPP